MERVVREVAATLGEWIAVYGQPLTAVEEAEHGAPARAHAVSDLRAMDEVERSLDSAETRIAHVLYALGVRGATNLAHRPEEYAGFPDAAAFLSWLFDDPNYPGLARVVPQAAAQQEEAWWAPTNLLFPEKIVKRSGEHRNFHFDQFRRSIEGAMQGRPRWVLESNELARWVIVQVEGQRLMTSSRLSVIVSTALRRTDDIAHLRWTIAAKELTSVAEIADKAEDLLVHPSVRLKFAPEGQSRIDTGAPTSENETSLAARPRALAAEIES